MSGDEVVRMHFARAEELHDHYVLAVRALAAWESPLADLGHRSAEYVAERPARPSDYLQLVHGWLQRDQADLRFRLDWIRATEAIAVDGALLARVPSQSGAAIADARWNHNRSVAELIAAAPTDHRAVEELAVRSLSDPTIATLVAQQLGMSWFTTTSATLRRSLWDAASPPPGGRAADEVSAATGQIRSQLNSLGVLFAAATSDLAAALQHLDEASVHELADIVMLLRAGSYDEAYLVAVLHRIDQLDDRRLAQLVSAMPGVRAEVMRGSTDLTDLGHPGSVVLAALLRSPGAPLAVFSDPVSTAAVLRLGPAPDIAGLRAEVLAAAVDAATSREDVRQLWDALDGAVAVVGLDEPLAGGVVTLVERNLWMILRPLGSMTETQPALGSASVELLAAAVAYPAVADRLTEVFIAEVSNRLGAGIESWASMAHPTTERLEHTYADALELLHLLWSAQVAEVAGRIDAAQSGDAVADFAFGVLKAIVNAGLKASSISYLTRQLLVHVGVTLHAAVAEGDEATVDSFDEFVAAIAVAEASVTVAGRRTTFPAGLQVLFVQALLDARPDLHRFVPAGPWFEQGEIRLPSDPNQLTPDTLAEFGVWFDRLSDGHNELADLLGAFVLALGPG